MANQTREVEKLAAPGAVDLDRDPRAIIGTREFDAPRALVFSAFIGCSPSTISAASVVFISLKRRMARSP